jgi:GntR family histidine utilization transcriptional repressor
MEKNNVPLYQQIKTLFVEKITRGELTSGMKIESEAELVDLLGVSRMTVNKAIRSLTDEGYLLRIPGSGTFVATKKPQTALLEIKSIAEEIKNRGGIYSSMIHRIHEERANPAVAAEMELQPYAPVFHAIVIHKDNNIPIQLSYRFINPSVFPNFLEQDFNQKTISDYLLQSASVTEMEHTIEALIPDAWIRDLLEINSSEPCLALQRKTWSGKVVATFSTFYYPGSRYSLFGKFSVSPSKVMNIT